MMCGVGANNSFVIKFSFTYKITFSWIDVSLIKTDYSTFSWPKSTIIYTIPYPKPVVFQWQSSGNPVCLELRPSVHWNATGERIVVASVFSVCFQWSSSGLPVVFHCVPIMQISTGLPLEYYWALASASVVPVAFQCICGSICLSVCSNHTNEHWIATGTPLGSSISQCGSSGIPVYLWLQWSSSVVCPVVS